MLRDFDARGADRDVDQHLASELDERPDAAEHERNHQPGEQPIRLARAMHLDDLHDEHGDQRVPSEADGGHGERDPAGRGVDRQSIGEANTGAVGHRFDGGTVGRAGWLGGVSKPGSSQSVAFRTAAARRSVEADPLPEETDQLDQRRKRTGRRE